MAAAQMLLGSAVLALAMGSQPTRGAKPESVDPWAGASEMRSSGWASTTTLDRHSGVPADLFSRAMTSLAPHYRDDHEALQAHLLEEHAIFMAETPHTARGYLCCTDYTNGPAVKSALESAAGGKKFVRTALNSNPFRAYCAVAHLPPASAAAAAEGSLVNENITLRCSPLTHASKEPLSLLGTVASGGDGSGDGSGDGHFGLRAGPSLQGGAKRGVVVTMSPGSLPVDPVRVGTGAAASTRGETEAAAGIRGGAGGRKLAGSQPAERSSLALKSLEERWRSSWLESRGRGGAKSLAEMIPWTSTSPRSGGGAGRRGLVVSEESEGRRSHAREFHDGKAAGYRAAMEHLGEKMQEGGTREGRALSEACGWDSNVSFVHGRDDLLYVRGVHHEDHDEATAMACFVGLVGFLSAQPEVMHIQPEAKAEATNKVLTAYVEGGTSTETPMRSAGLDGKGEVIGVTDTGLDDNSCFFRDDENGQVPRTTMSDASYYSEYRKVIQYVVYADDKDADGHGTHVSGIAAGKIYDDWEDSWKTRVSTENCEDKGLLRSCFGDCVEGLVGSSCHWNAELACPMSDCDEDASCDEDTGYTFPCFEDPEDELPDASGMAPGAKLAFFDIGEADEGLIIPDDIGDMWDAQYAAGARIMSNSWSLVTMTEPTARDVQLDEWIHSNPDAFVVFGAGNNGYDGGFNPGSVQSPATAKTAMTVGASNSGPDRAYAYYSSASSNYDGVLWPEDDVSFEVSPFSARGPVGRFTAKPDVVAPGLMVHSAKASLSEDGEETCALDSLGGTSMSAPAVAGAAALVRQYFREGVLADYLDDEDLCNDGSIYEEAGLCEAFEPAGYLVKAVLVNSAKWLGNMQTVSFEDTVEWMTVLDFAQGFGAVQMASSMPTPDSPTGAFFHQHELESEELHYYSIYVDDPSEDFSVTVAWYDPPSMVSSYTLLHDLDTFVMSVESRRYFRSNSYNTMLAMCEGDEACARKYEFTFHTHLADHMNPVERIVIDSDDLEEGYYVIGVRARTFTESDTQTYGLAAAGGGLVLHDMAKYWNDLGVSTQSTGGGNGEEPNPDEDGALSTPTPSPATTWSPTDLDSSYGGKDFVIAAPGTPAPSVGDPHNAGEAATSSYSTGTSVDDFFEHSDTTAGDGFRESTSEGRTDDGYGSGDVSAYAAVGGDDEGSGSDALSPTTEITGGGGDGSSGGWTSQSKIAIAASVAGAVALVGVGMCLAMRRRKGSDGEETRSFFCSRPLAARASVGDDEAKDDCDEYQAEEEDFYDDRRPSIDARLPGYATAVACAPEEEGKTIIRTSSGKVEMVEIGAGFESEVSGFYAAVDPDAVSKLVGWGISRDFARVALRQHNNDIPSALKMIAEGDMDAQLAMDHEEMAREGAAAAAELALEPELESEAETTALEARA